MQEAYTNINYINCDLDTVPKLHFADITSKLHNTAMFSHIILGS
jgi:hypothetical protein